MARPNILLCLAMVSTALCAQQPSSRAVDSPLNRFDYALVDPVIVLDEWAQWEKRWSALFLKGQKIRRETD